MRVDIGARSYDEVMQAGIRPGDRVTFDTTFQVLPHQRVMGKAFDDRLGCYLLVTLLRELHDAELPAEVWLNTGGTVLNIFWLIFFGWWLCLMHIATGIAQCISIIGIPVGIANFKIAAIALCQFALRDDAGTEQCVDDDRG